MRSAKLPVPRGRNGISPALFPDRETARQAARSWVIGGGGLGDLAIRYGYIRNETDVMLVIVVLLLILVQGVQWLGDRLATRLNKK